MRSMSAGTTVLNLNKGQLAGIELAAPPLPEQRQIAEILDTLDEAIRKTEAIIAKLKQVKQGLLHDLLTRGIDDNGELRDPERHPEQFKDSPLGRIPREWEVVTSRDMLTVQLGFAIRSGELPMTGGDLQPPGGQHRNGRLEAFARSAYLAERSVRADHLTRKRRLSAARL